MGSVYWFGKSSRNGAAFRSPDDGESDPSAAFETRQAHQTDEKAAHQKVGESSGAEALIASLQQTFRIVRGRGAALHSRDLPDAQRLVCTEFDAAINRGLDFSNEP